MKNNIYGQIQKKNDGTFIISFNGLPFLVTPDYPQESQYGHEWTFEAVNAHAVNHPEDVADYVEPEPSFSCKDRIKMLMYQNDVKSVRALRSVSAGIATDEDLELLAQIEAEQAALRAELAKLECIK